MCWFIFFITFMTGLSLAQFEATKDLLWLPLFSTISLCAVLHGS